jgi:decaprenylphospho-beta-D-ribofuranose 2-oxidase
VGLLTEEQLISGWGGTSKVRSVVHRPSTKEEVERLMRAWPQKGSIARGLGRAYGDAAQVNGGVVLDSSALQDLDWVDLSEGIVSVGAGVSLADLCRAALAEGWFPPVLPGTKHVSIGGAIAADIHGKNEHRAGTFCDHVASLDLCSPARTIDGLGTRFEPGVFSSTAGGMGLTGMITRADLHLKKVAGPLVQETKWREANLDSLVRAVEAAVEEFEYVVAWLDVTADGSDLGRGVITCGSHVSAAGRGDAESNGSGPKRLRVPAGIPFNLVRQGALERFNSLIYGRATSSRQTEIVTWDRFFFPLDAIDGWNRLYGKRGFVQYQFVVPNEDALKDVINHVAKEGLRVTLATLKRFTRAGPGHLSFATPGWSLAIDLAWTPSVVGSLQRLDETVIGHEGRIYLAKDSCSTPKSISAMYPELETWRATQRSLDPRGLLRSDLGARLELV